MLSKRAKILKPSPTLAMAARARELESKGHDVVSLTVGEPDWPTFKVANQAATKAISDGFTKYTAAAGIIELREEIAKNCSQNLGIKYFSNEVVVGAGAKFILYAAMQMLLNEGDEVLIPAPYWVSYPAMVELAGAVPKVISCGKEQNFKLTAEALQKNISAKTKAIILCSPSNPTGMMYSSEELYQIAQVLKANPNIFILSDDIYDHLVFGPEGRAPHILDVAPELRDRVLIVNGASKTYAMTGWRVGWGVGPMELMKAMADFCSQSTSNVTSISQKAVLGALKDGASELAEAVQKLKNKKEFFQKQLAELKLIKMFDPQGAFYFWVSIENCFGKKIDGLVLQNSKQVADVLLDKYFVATVPGIEFGTEGYLRLSFAASDESLVKAIQRFKEFEAALG